MMFLLPIAILTAVSCSTTSENPVNAPQSAVTSGAEDGEGNATATASALDTGCFIYDGPNVSAQEFVDIGNARTAGLKTVAAALGTPQGQLDVQFEPNEEIPSYLETVLPDVPEGGLAAFSRWRCEGEYSALYSTLSFRDNVEAQKQEPASAGLSPEEIEAQIRNQFDVLQSTAVVDLSQALGLCSDLGDTGLTGEAAIKEAEQDGGPMNEPAVKYLCPQYA
jgi:hypothetical protein